MAAARLKGVARGVLWFEPLVLAVTTLAFWYPTPTRTDWLWLLWLLVPLAVARTLVHGRLLTRTPLDVWFAAFLILGSINVYAAPYTRGLMMLARPLLGMVMVYAMIEAARTSGQIRGPLQALTILALLVGLLAIGATQWNAKSLQLRFITDILPTIRGFPGAETGFNVNEIGGALAWLAPLMGGVAVYRWQQRGLRWDVTAAFVLLFFALMLGQSRSAVIGVLVAFFVMIPLLVRRTPWRLLAYAAWVGVVGLQLLISSNFAQQQAQVVEQAGATSADAGPALQTYDENSLSNRLEIWNSALAIVRDRPLTGVGLSMFRDGRVRAAYPVPSMEGKILPHAHNELLQIASDMGLPGLIVFIGIYAAAGYMLLQCWRRGDAQARAVSVAVVGGLLAHLIFGMADAITLWDRFAFVFWMLIGLAGAQYVLVMRPASTGE